VGKYNNGGGNKEAFRWSQEEDIVGLGFLPPPEGLPDSEAKGISADGTVVVGKAKTTNGKEAFIWTLADGMVSLGDLPGGKLDSEARAVSADGSVVVGKATGDDGTGKNQKEAFIWDAVMGMRVLGDLAGGKYEAEAKAVSANGLVVVGKSASGFGKEAFIWTEADGMVGLGALAVGPNFDSDAMGISADGTTVVGKSKNADANKEAFIWDATNGMQGLGALDADNFDSEAKFVSADGSIVVGKSTNAAGDKEVFIWDATAGMQSLRQVLIDRGLDLTDWTLDDVSGISTDGRNVYGIGTHAGIKEFWTASLPEPSTGLLVTMGLGVLAIARRRQLRSSTH
jgi:probable HAF family extracellular repeat protein